ncbi:hypothetical protein DFH06DRAFT_1123253 [Mycena polygramma]|nr:hypothetical protein DFH06DRAFT_1123253 [Mycena polygramma]
MYHRRREVQGGLESRIEQDETLLSKENVEPRKITHLEEHKGSVSEVLWKAAKENAHETARGGMLVKGKVRQWNTGKGTEKTEKHRKRWMDEWMDGPISLSRCRVEGEECPKSLGERHDCTGLPIATFRPTSHTVCASGGKGYIDKGDHERREIEEGARRRRGEGRLNVPAGASIVTQIRRQRRKGRCTASVSVHDTALALQPLLRVLRGMSAIPVEGMLSRGADEEQGDATEKRPLEVGSRPNDEKEVGREGEDSQNSPLEI